MLPFFTLGWWLHQHGFLERHGFLHRRRVSLRIAAAAVLAAAGVCAWLFVDELTTMHLGQWLFYEQDYADLGGTQWWAGGIRLLLMAIALVLSASFFVLVPRREYRWTAIGRYTMYVYLLHSFVLYPLRESGILRGLDPTWLWLPLVALLSAAITVGLASKPVRRVFRPLVEPRPGWLFADPDLVHPGATRTDPTGSRRPQTPTPAGS